MDPVCILGILDLLELQKTPRPNLKAARSCDTCDITSEQKDFAEVPTEEKDEESLS